VTDEIALRIADELSLIRETLQVLLQAMTTEPEQEHSACPHPEASRLAMGTGWRCELCGHEST
jgi:hypothetical protein